MKHKSNESVQKHSETEKSSLVSDLVKCIEELQPMAYRTR